MKRGRKPRYVPPFEVIKFTQTPKRLMEFAEEYGMSRTTAQRILDDMIDEKIVAKTGGGRTTRYTSNFHTYEHCKKDKFSWARRRPYGVAIVNVLADHPMSSEEISEELDIPIANTYRIIQQLVGLGFLTFWGKKTSKAGHGKRLWFAAVAYRKHSPSLKVKQQYGYYEGRGGLP